MRKSEEEQGTAILRYGKAVLSGGVMAFLLAVAILLAVAFGVAQGILDAGLCYQFTVISCVLGSFVGGLFAVRQCRGQSLLLGIGVGAALFLLQLSFGILLYDTLSFENGGLGLLCGALCGGGAAGILGKGRRGHTGKKRRKR